MPEEIYESTGVIVEEPLESIRDNYENIITNSVSEEVGAVTISSGSNNGVTVTGTTTTTTGSTTRYFDSFIMSFTVEDSVTSNPNHANQSKRILNFDFFHNKSDIVGYGGWTKLLLDLDLNYQAGLAVQSPKSSCALYFDGAGLGTYIDINICNITYGIVVTADLNENLSIGGYKSEVIDRGMTRTTTGTIDFNIGLIGGVAYALSNLPYGNTQPIEKLVEAVR